MAQDISLAALKRFIDGSRIPMTLADATPPDCPIIVANDAFLALTGYRREEVVGRGFRFLQGPLSEDEARDKMRLAISGGIEALVPITNYRRDGSTFENLVHLAPIKAADGSPRFIMCSQYDVTAQPDRVALGESPRPAAAI